MAVQNLLVNPELSTTVRISGRSTSQPQGAVDALPGWFLIHATTAQRDAAVTCHRGYARLTGDHGTRLIQVLSQRTDSARLTADVRVRSGTVLVGAVFNRDVLPSVQIKPASDGARDAWQHVDLGTQHPVNQVVFYCAEPNTVVDIRHVMLTLGNSAPAVVQPTTIEPAALPINNGGGGGGQPDPMPYLRITNLACPGGIGAEPGAWFPVTVSVDPYLVGQIRVSVSCNTKTYPASLLPDGTFRAQVRVYAAGSSLISVHAAGMSTLGRWSSHYQQPFSSDDTAYIPVSFASPVPTAVVSAPTSIVLLDGQTTYLPITVTTADTTQFGSRTVVPVGRGQQATLTQQDATTFSGTLPINNWSPGDINITVFVSCTDFPSAPPGEPKVTVQGLDRTPPSLSVLYPHPGVPTVLTDLASPIHVEGVAADDQSGVETVTWSLTAGDPAPSTAQTSDGWKSWAADVIVPEYAVTTLYLWVTDKAGNTTMSAIDMDVRKVRPANTIEQRLEPSWYLLDLLDFACDATAGQLRTGAAGTTERPTIAQISDTLRQPIDRIALPQSDLAADTAQADINELRVPIEILRAHITASGIAAAPDKPAYVQAAYESILSSLGTSYLELRLARAATPDADTALATRLGITAEARTALAARLGINLTGPSAGVDRPDQLDLLTLDPNSTLTEATLESLFGLASTQRTDPLQPVQPGAILGWQIAAARIRWQADDHQPRPPASYAVVLDPDIVGQDEILSADMAATLAVRRSLLDNQKAALTAARGGAVAPAAALSALLDAGVPGFDLAGVLGDLADGQDVSDALNSAGLDVVGLNYLAQLQQLITIPNTAITDAEWADTEDVLVAALRRRSYPAWRLEEATAGYVFGPETAAATAAPTVGWFRQQPTARADWERTLLTRTTEFQALHDSATAMVRAAEQDAFPILREALLDDIAGAGGEDADALTRRYQLDMRSSGTRITTRIAAATASLQLLYQQVHDGTVVAGSPAHGWTVAAGFDSAWLPVMSSYSAWRGGITTYLFPEQMLDPVRYTPPTANYSILVASTQNGAALDAVAINKAITTWQGVVQTWLDSIPVAPAATDFVYLRDDPATQQANRSQLAQYSRNILQLDPVHHQGDIDTVREVFWAAPMLIGAALRDQAQYEAALTWFALLFNYPDPAAQQSIYSVIQDEQAVTPPAPAQLGDNIWAITVDPFSLTAAPGRRPAPHLRATLLAIIDCLLAYGDQQFTAETEESLALASQLYLQAQTLTGHPCLAAVQPDPSYEPKLNIPRLDTLTTAIASRLNKIRAGRNITGDPIVVVEDTQALFQATPYSYKVLLARAQQLTAQATQIETQYESALANLDTQNLAQINAKGAATVAQAQVDAHTQQVAAASDGVTLADAQYTRATTARDSLQQAIAQPPNAYEQRVLDGFKTIRDLQNGIAGADTALGIAQAASSAANIADEFFSGGSKAVLFGVQAAALGTKLGLDMALNNAQEHLQANQLLGSIEARRDEWRIQLASAQQDVAVAKAQQAVANDQLAVAKADLTVANDQLTAANDTLTALLNANMSAATYAWLVQTLGGVYRYFLQHATATARLAQTQLGFERAQPIGSFIGADYTVPPAALVDANTPKDTFGLAGAELLARDLEALDEYAFSTDQRKLNISQTFSLAQLFPLEFLQFRDTGELTVTLPSRLFDQDFPGDYLRLIRQVRLSIIALVPPNRGIRARLTNNGISRVTTPAATGMTDTILRRNPQSIEVTSPISATGVFDLDPQPGLLLPFEGSGVDTSWQLSLPKAANPFDYQSIADATITVDYTALPDSDYRDLVIRDLNTDRSRSGDCLMSLSNEYPDQWYQLCNPADTTAPRTVTIAAADTAFPANLTAIATTAITVRMESSAGTALASGTVTISRAGTSADATTDGSGFAGTRRGATAWNDLLGDPTGSWQLTLDRTLGDQIDSGAIIDVVFDLTWSGQAPAWPT